MNIFKTSDVSKKNPIICWFSGGVTSAIACKIASNMFGLENCRFIFIDTNNEDEDTYRFLDECSKWYGATIEKMSNSKYSSIQEVWRNRVSLNTAHGAACSNELKSDVRRAFQKNNNYSYQVFGFDIDETKRAKNLTKMHPKAKGIYPLLMFGYDKPKCVSMLQEAEIDIPKSYMSGFNNNNCMQTGCVRGGIGYWQKIQRESPDKFNNMAKMEHELTDKKGVPVTLIRDQSKASKASRGGRNPVFLLPHPDYPQYKDLSMMKGREPKPLAECNGTCSRS